MDEHSALLAIQELLDGVVWTPQTLDDIAAVLRQTGYQVRGIEQEDSE